MRVDAAVPLADELGQRIEIRRAQFGKLTVLHDFRRQGVVVFELFEYVGCCRIAAALVLLRLLRVQLQHVEEYMAELLGGIHVEFLARKLDHLLLQALYVAGDAV